MTLSQTNKSKSGSSITKSRWLNKLWYSATVVLIAAAVTVFLAVSGQLPNQLNQTQQSQLLASQQTCSVLPVGATEAAPVGTPEHSADSAVSANGLSISIDSINYLSSGLVIVNYRVTNNSIPLASSELYNNTGLIGSDAKYYYACLTGTAGCHYDSSPVAIKPGQTRSTCVVYFLPANALPQR